MKSLHFVTSNKNKVKEAQSILGVPITIIEMELDEVQSMDLEYVAKRKAEAAFRIAKRPIIIDDVGVFLDAWNSFPGPFAKFVHEYIGNKKLLQMFEGERKRGVTVKAIVAYHDGKKVHIFTGIMKGKIAKEELGSSWGFDPIIIPEGETLTLAQLGERKNNISHRAKALKKFKNFLDKEEK